jgi:AcrR family transcriptional regulator
MSETLEQRRQRHDFRRARSEPEKERRRRDILAAARAQLAQVGVESFSMVPLAKETGVARGTLYLYT